MRPVWNRTLSEAAGYPAPHSFWYKRLERCAAPAAIHDWLVDQANLRGFYGAYGRVSFATDPDPRISLEELVVALMAPQAPVDGRTLKLVLRILQSGKVAPDALHYLARREKAESALYWLLQITPTEEVNSSLRRLQEQFAEPPRGYRGIAYRYDAQRLVRRPASKGDLWRAKQS